MDGKERRRIDDELTNIIDDELTNIEWAVANLRHMLKISEDDSDG